NKTIIELEQNKTYSHNDLAKITSKNSGFTKSCLAVLTNQDYSIKKLYGSSTRGGSDDPWYYDPKDSLIILSDSILFKVGNSSSELTTDISLYDTIIKNKMILDKKSNIHKIKCPEPGNYTWNYNIKYGSEKKNYRNFFIVPELKEKETILKDYNDFMDAISKFSLELQQCLEEEFCSIKKIYFLK
ncbi:MAG: hypothetical protein ACK452_04570, partial [Bacteroidota bacterium]